jgi:hydrogenase maturation protease
MSVVIGVGQARAGDDAVGLHVARALRARGVDARESADASALLPLLERGERVVLVDALLDGAPPGTVRELAPGDLAVSRALSTHGVDLAAVLELGRVLYGDRALADVAIVAVSIDGARLDGTELTPEVAAAIAPAAELARRLAGERSITGA